VDGERAWKWSWINLSYRGICLEETTKNLIRDDSRCPGRDSERVHSECQSHALPFKITFTIGGFKTHTHTHTHTHTRVADSV
jgi:hypothetical protein